MTPCPHGHAVGVRCLPCGRERTARYRARKRAEQVAAGVVIKTTKGPAPQHCPHGVLGLSNCSTCHNERINARRERERAAKVAAGWEPWAVQRQPCRHGFARSSDCRICLLDKSILGTTRHRLQPSAAFDPTVTLSALIERDGGVCGHGCGRTLYIARDRASSAREDAATVDHRIPLSLGGAHVWANVLLSCRACNTEKSDDVCEACSGPISVIGEPLCAKCVTRRRGARQRFAVCRHCGYVEMDSGWCDRCKAKGADIWAAVDMTRVDANAMSRQMGFEPRGRKRRDTTEWIQWMVA